jgi:hypothetical protein
MTAEDVLQSQCITTFRLRYPEYRKILISIPNGANLSDSQRILFSRTGLMPGASDMIFLVPRHGYGSLCIEAKVRKGFLYTINRVTRIVKRDGVQSPEQHEWELQCLSHGNKYVIIRSVEEFMKEIADYLN